MALDPVTVKVLAKIAAGAATDERIRQVILIACLVPFIIILLVLSSPFAIFFSITGMESGNSTSVAESMYALRQSFAYQLQKEQNDSSVDEVITVIVGSDNNQLIDNTADVLMVFAIKYNVKAKEAMQMSVLDKKQLEKLKKVFWDMNSMKVETESSKGKEKDIIKSKTIYVHALTAKEMAVIYGFDDTQIAVLEEMRKR